MYDLNRFKKAQNSDYRIALEEVKAGRKTSHWIWYIFPQLKGLERQGTVLCLHFFTFQSLLKNGQRFYDEVNRCG